MADPMFEAQPLKRCTLVKLHGRLDSSKAPLVEEKFKELIDSGVYRFVIDLSGVEFISSAFLRVLISTSKAVRRFNRGDIYLAALPKRIHEVLDLSGLSTLFQIYDNETEAVGNW